MVNGRLKTLNIIRRGYGTVIERFGGVIMGRSSESIQQYFQLAPYGKLEMNFTNNTYNYTSLESTLKVYVGEYKHVISLKSDTIPSYLKGFAVSEIVIHFDASNTKKKIYIYLCYFSFIRMQQLICCFQFTLITLIQFNFIISLRSMFSNKIPTPGTELYAVGLVSCFTIYFTNNFLIFILFLIYYKSQKENSYNASQFLYLKLTVYENVNILNDTSQFCAGMYRNELIINNYQHKLMELVFKDLSRCLET